MTEEAGEENAEFEASTGDFEDVIDQTGRALRLLRDNPPAANYLTESLKGIFTARQALVADAQYTTNLLLVTMGGAGAVCSTAAAAWNTLHPPFPLMAVAFLLATAILLTVRPVGRTLLTKLQAGYDLYVAASVHSMIIHRSLNFPPGCHRWLAFADYQNKHFTGYFSDLIRPDIDRILSARVTYVHDEQGRRPRNVYELEAAWKAEGGTLLAAYKGLVYRLTLVAHVGALLALLVAGISLWKWLHNGI